MLLTILLACTSAGESGADSKPVVDTDRDGDGFIAVEDGGDDCWDDPDTIPDAYVAVQGESQPVAADVHPEATDFPYDGVDADCAGDSDFDLDNDGVDADDKPQEDGSVGTDCNDEDAASYPGAAEVTGDGRDQDCDGGELCFEDADGDLHAAVGGATVGSADLDCLDAGEAGVDVQQDDCEDGNPSIYPGAAEVTADGVDEDCDGLESCVVDADLDAYGNNAGETVLSTSMTCSLEGQVTNTDDCDDTNGAVYPYAPEACDGIANDCGATSDWDLTREDGLITFRADGTGALSDATPLFAAGTGTTPAGVEVTTPGTYSLCTGSWYAGFVSNGVDFTATVPDGHSVTLSFNGKSGSVISVTSANATISNLTLAGGNGTTVDDVRYGGVLYTTDETGGGFVVSLNQILVDRATGADVGGAIAALGSASVEVRASWLEGSADRGGIAYIEDGSLACVADGEPDAGFFNANANELGGAVYLATDAGTFTSDGCDFDANTPDDIAGANGSWEPYLLSPLYDASFACTGSGGCAF